MKKAISIVLTVVMLFAVCVPAFALVDISDTGLGKLDVITKTTTEDGKDAASYSVNIPSDAKIDWGAPSKDVSYSVESHLRRNERVRVVVSVGDSGNISGTMKTDPANGKVYELAYTLSGKGVDYTAEEPVVYNNAEEPAISQPVNVVINEEDWNKAVVERYQDTLTYTAEVVTVGE